MARLLFIQNERWQDASGRGIESHYSDKRCCFCWRKTKPDADRLLTARTNDGEWWLVSTDEDMRAAEWRDFQDQLDGTFKPTPLPIGPDCLKRHPQFHFAIDQRSARANGGKDQQGYSDGQ